MQAHGMAIDVVADNIANVNTPGFKAARAQFQSLMAQTLRGAGSPITAGRNPFQIGLGVTIGTVERQMTQGSPQTTGRATDLTIEGNGFFMLQAGPSYCYTRNGAFDVNGDRVLVEAVSGAAVLGWSSDAQGRIDTSQPPAAIVLPATGDSLARATTRVSLGGNLNTDANVGAATTTVARVYDSQGREHQLQVTFTKSGDNAWSWAATDEGGATIGSGTVEFDGNGQCTTPAAALSVPVAGGATTPLQLNLEFGIQQLAAETLVAPTYQDGLPSGSFEGFTVTETGVLIGSFSNGLSRALGQLALATFTNPAGLQRASSGAYTETANSGPRQVNAPGSAGNGRLISGSLEMSNVDLTREFSALITLQRGFQANGRSITTSDQLLQDVLMLKQ